MSLLSLTKRLRGRSDKAQDVPAKSKAAVKPKPKEAQGVDSAPRSNGSAGALLALYPVMSEKSVRLQEDNIVTFRVSHTATKGQVARAIEQRYKVKPRKIRMVYGRPKNRRRGQTIGRTAAWKKAYVKVDDVQSLIASP